jgi:hypothetical protein
VKQFTQQIMLPQLTAAVVTAALLLAGQGAVGAARGLTAEEVGRQSANREIRVLRVFAAWNPDAASVLIRGIGPVNLRDNGWLELSGGWLRGDEVDMLSRLSMREFAYARIKVHF